MFSCDGIGQEEVLLTGTDLINVTIFVVLFIAFCDINYIMHGSTIANESLCTRIYRNLTLWVGRILTKDTI